MIETNKIYSKSFNIQRYFPALKNNEVILFDIETTGLSPYKSQLYLIGCIYWKNKEWIFHQFFAESIQEEKVILSIFLDICKSFKFILHFNGDTFDIPFLKKKASQLNIQCTLNTLNSIDMLKLIRPFQSILNLENCKLKTIERFIKVDRKDPYTGGELIEQYQVYCKNPQEYLKDNLLLHNEEDIYGLVELCKIIDIITFIQNISNRDCVSDIINIELCRNKLSFSLKLLEPSPFSHLIKKDTWTCSMYEGKLFIDFDIILLNNTLYHYFSNYKEYYYLPEQDEAVHKSIGTFLPKEKRRPALASNCYIKKTGLFLQVMNGDIDSPVFYQSNNSKEAFIYFEYNNLLNHQKQLIEFALDFIKSLIPSKKSVQKPHVLEK